MSQISGNGITASFKYSDAGIRTQKTVNGVTTTYHLDGSLVTYETDGTDVMYYTYDSVGQLVSMNLNGEEYFYIRNIQGDIIGLIDETGAEVVSYTYDTWGKVISISGSLASTVGEKNPYLYRGYRYDSETGLYYLQARYYNPEWGRFLNADEAIGKIGGIQGHNLYQYCFNNPVMMSDPSGNWPELSTVLTGVAVVAGIVAVGAIIVATAGLAAPALAVAGGATLGGLAGGAAILAAEAWSIAVAAGIGATTAKTSEKLQQANHTVYRLVDEKGNTQYVGRTIDTQAREKAHKADPNRGHLDFKVMYSGLNYKQARGIEQIKMIEYTTINLNNKMNNQINGISPRNKKYGVYMEAGRNYLSNVISNEILYWTGQ